MCDNLKIVIYVNLTFDCCHSHWQDRLLHDDILVLGFFWAEESGKCKWQIIGLSVLFSEVLTFFTIGHHQILRFRWMFFKGRKPYLTNVVTTIGSYLLLFKKSNVSTVNNSLHLNSPSQIFQHSISTIFMDISITLNIHHFISGYVTR